ncbi:hypothetical protein [Phyllobacterium leguminum]|uniref:Uncharacterized protein n=1 Tax=Phyllobacterium leguminum TaxID=314237 RepID=A0A318T5M0_9HYPH|nr:hypothetical protein [Phyllobacterium leguminum]PYE89574.1 hypothetical protein C7477_10382 [Phyllobacterium leguminum]
MAIIFPLSIAALADKLPIESVDWKLMEQQELSGLGSGEVLAADLGPRLWEAQAQLGQTYNDDAAELQALFETLDGAINPFYLYDPRKPFPRSDPTGAILGATKPKISSIGSNMKSMSLEALPDGYVLSVGDYLAFDYGTNPVRRALHRICEAATANSSGVTPVFEVRPHVRPGATVGTEVMLKKPSAKVILIPKSFSAPSAGALTSTISFQVRQTLSQ